MRLYLLDAAGPNLRRNRPVVQVVVLGDIGRSPRIRSHAVSLADANCDVDLIGYTETAPGSRISTHRHITLRTIYSAWSVPEGMPRVLYLAWSPFKALFVAGQLIWIMGGVTQKPDYILIQAKNPPAIPTLAIAQLVCRLRNARLVIDWHNFGYSVLGTKLGAQSKVVNLAKKYEQFFGRNAYAHLTVTDRMHRELTKWGVSGRVITFKDRPLYHFERLPVDKIHETLDSARFLGCQESPEKTLLTELDDDNIKQFRKDRIRLIVSSTSWTDDEDFGILLRAVEQYEAMSRQASKPYPRLLFVITGKGPLRDMYERKISAMHLERTRIVTAWLDAGDYPLLLGSADLGISLHTSTSGMDLPMKVVDMFGCGLPVCAYNFECLDELVLKGQNGLPFESSEELAEQWLVSVFLEYETALITSWCRIFLCGVQRNLKSSGRM
ncbi:glycosyl transferases group 1-domain-containing protein [Dichotomocladium elegans]|nr:glycosyl transferases group 1-domain-containing protein [Dichotomocladium elegans]